jgi:hypothetical protein
MEMGPLSVYFVCGCTAVFSSAYSGTPMITSQTKAAAPAR